MSPDFTRVTVRVEMNLTRRMTMYVKMDPFTNNEKKQSRAEHHHHDPDGTLQCVCKSHIHCEVERVSETTNRAQHNSVPRTPYDAKADDIALASPFHRKSRPGRDVICLECMLQSEQEAEQ